MVDLLFFFLLWCFTGLSKVALLAAVEAPASFLEQFLLHVQVLWILLLLLKHLHGKIFVGVGSHHVSRCLLLGK